MTLRSDFVAGLDFALDDFQVRALDALDAGRSVLVAAPTGSGKTIIGEYAVARALSRGGKCFYTTPIKALSNQKFADLREKYGNEKVGLLTGDNSINGSAAVVVMTTEVLRNMIYADSAALRGLEAVVLDEVHYLQDRHRGSVWEEVMVHLPLEVDLVCLSATVSNAEEFAEWIETVRGSTTVIIEEKRPVDLRHRYLVAERGVDGLIMLPTFVDDKTSTVPNPDALRLDRRSGRGPRGMPRPARRLAPPRRPEMLERLEQEDLLPAIVFIFSRAGCDDAVRQCVAAQLSYTTSDERKEIDALIEKHTEGLSDDDLMVLGFGPWRAGLEAGIAAHHAGLVPPFKEAVEEGFTRGLIKVVFATETLALGINMPARTVVIEKLTKFTGDHHEFLTPGEYTQLTGRAGRRGLDAVGYAVVLWSPWTSFEQVAGLASRRTDALRSSFRSTYNMTVNLINRYSPEHSKNLLNLSFAQFHADREIVTIERQLTRRRKSSISATERAVSSYGDLDEYRSLLQVKKAEKINNRKTKSGAETRSVLGHLAPGDIVWMGGRGGDVLVLSQQTKRNSTALFVMLSSGRTARLRAGDFRDHPETIGHIVLSTPYAPRNQTFQKHALKELRKFSASNKQIRTRKTQKVDNSTKDTKQHLAAAIRNHPVAQDVDLKELMKAADERDRLNDEIIRLERRVSSRSDSLAQQFERVRSLLDRWDYVSGWSLEPRGQILARLYSESDLLLAESIARGDLDGLDAPELAALISCFTYESRSRDDDSFSYPDWPTKKLGQRIANVEKTAQEILAAELSGGLLKSRLPDSGFVGLMYDWVSGRDLFEVLSESDLAGGDFVRCAKQCIDVLRQCSLVAPIAQTQAAATEAADIAQRGVVSALGAVSS